MQTTQDGSLAPVPVVWFRVSDDTPFGPMPSWDSSRKWLEDEDHYVSRVLGEQNIDDGEYCSPSCYTPYYNGRPPAPYKGRGDCGSLMAWLEGGLSGRDPIIETDEFGVGPCCDLDELTVGGEQEGAPSAQKVRVDIATQATPLLASARVTRDTLAPVAFSSGVTLDWTMDPSGDVPYSWERGAFWNEVDPTHLTAPFDGEYEVSCSVELTVIDLPDFASVRLGIQANSSEVGAISVGSDTDLAAPGISAILDLCVTGRVRLLAGDTVQAGLSVQGSGALFEVQGDTGVSFSLTMIGTRDAHVGPTGVCNTMITAGVDEPSEPFCVTNPTECCPSAEEDPLWPFALDWSAEVEFNDEELPEWDVAYDWSAAVAGGAGLAPAWEYATGWSATVDFGSASEVTFPFAFDLSAAMGAGVGMSALWPVAFDCAATVGTGMGLPTPIEYAFNWSATVTFGPSATLVFHDTFDDAPLTALNSHTPNFGMGWTAFSGSWRIGVSGADANSNPGAGYVSADGPPTANQAVQAVLGGTGMILLLRASTTGGGDGYSIECRGGLSTRVWKFSGGGDPRDTLLYTTSGTYSAGDTFRLEVTGTSFTVKVNGTTDGTFSDSTYSSGYCGMYSSDGVNEFWVYSI